MPSPSLCGALAATVDGRHAASGGAFSLSRARWPMDPPSSSSRADGSSSGLLCLSFLASVSYTRPPELQSVPPHSVSIASHLPWSHPTAHSRAFSAHMHQHSEHRSMHAPPPLSRVARLSLWFACFASSSSSIKAKAARSSDSRSRTSWQRQSEEGVGMPLLLRCQRSR
jgi:hypothetical protein